MIQNPRQKKENFENIESIKIDDVHTLVDTIKVYKYHLPVLEKIEYQKGAYGLLSLAVGHEKEDAVQEMSRLLGMPVVVNSELSEGEIHLVFKNGKGVPVRRRLVFEDNNLYPTL